MPGAQSAGRVRPGPGVQRPDSRGATPGPRDSRLEQSVVVHPGNMPKYGRGWRRGTQFVAAEDRTRDIDAGQPARDRRYVAVILIL